MSTDAPIRGPLAAETRAPMLADYLPGSPTGDSDLILDRFLAWVEDSGFELDPAQTEAIRELMAGHHVLLEAPTGSRRSLVAVALHFKGLCEGRRSFSTSPRQALAGDKLLDLCAAFGAERVGMRSGDAAINPQAPVVCCTAEVLANGALRQGAGIGADYVVMDEFHHYADPERGAAWQIPLITLPRSTFLLMSATAGDGTPIAERLTSFSGRRVALVSSHERQVPLDFEYRETSVLEAVRDLLEEGKAPIYIVSFDQRQAAELAQTLTRLELSRKQDRQHIVEALGGLRFDSPQGQECRRLLGSGVGLYHAGLLPQHRLQVEQLAQQGLLTVISGTDTLGLGGDIPIRTLLLTGLSRFDGTGKAPLTVRDFQQLVGRAGRKGVDDRGSVVCLAPRTAVESGSELKRHSKRRSKKRKGRRGGEPSRPQSVSWNRQTFERLIARRPETLESRFRVTRDMVVNLLQHDAELDDPDRDELGSLRALIANCHEPEAAKSRLVEEAVLIVRSLHRAGVVSPRRDPPAPSTEAAPTEPATPVPSLTPPAGETTTAATDAVRQRRQKAGPPPAAIDLATAETSDRRRGGRLLAATIFAIAAVGAGLLFSGRLDGPLGHWRRPASEVRPRPPAAPATTSPVAADLGPVGATANEGAANGRSEDRAGADSPTREPVQDDAAAAGAEGPDDNALPAAAAPPAGDGVLAPPDEAAARAALARTLAAWAAAWSRQDPEAYLAFYDPTFAVPGGLSRADWESQRRERLRAPQSVAVEISGFEVEAWEGATAQVRLFQSYRSESNNLGTWKRFDMVWRADGWRIARESRVR